MRLARLLAVAALAGAGISCGGGADDPAGPARPTLDLGTASAAPYGIVVGVVSGRTVPASGMSARVGPDTAIVRRIDDSTLAIMMPEVAVGTHELRLALGPDTISASVQALAAPAVGDAAAFVGGRLDVAQADLEQLEGELAAGMGDADTTTLRADLARARMLVEQARARMASSTPEERAFAARVLAANAGAFGNTASWNPAAAPSGSPSVMLAANSGYCIADDGRLLDTYEECSENLVLFGRRRMREIALLGAFTAIAYAESLTVLGAFLGVATGALVAVEIVKVGVALYRRAVVPAVAAIVKLFDFGELGDELRVAMVALQTAEPVPEYFVSGRGRALRVRAEYRSLQASDASVAALASRVATLRRMESLVNGIRSALFMSPMAPLVPAAARRSVVAEVPLKFLSLGDIAPTAITGTSTVADTGWIARFTRTGITADIPFSFDVDYTATGLPTRSTTASAVLIATPRFMVRTLAGGQTGSAMCAIDVLGAQYCWGHNLHGRLGDLTTTDRPLPTRTRTGLDLVSLTMGDWHTCGLTAGGVAHCWGETLLGDTTQSAKEGRLTAGPVRTSLTFSTLSAGRSEVCGLSGGRAVCWGYIVSLFDTTGNSHLVRNTELPMQLPFSPTFSSLEAGSGQACGLTSTGSVACFGRNGRGQVGDGTRIDRGRATTILGGRTYKAVATGEAHACALTTAGAAYCWGEDGRGQIGDGYASSTNGLGVLTPAPVAGGLTFAQIDAGAFHTCALTEAGKAYCWGDNVSGESGTSSSLGGSQNVPAPVATNVLFRSLSLGRAVSCGIAKVGGATYCWGSNFFGEAGIGASSDNVPVSTVVPPQP